MFFQEPREKPASEIKLLRVELLPKANSPFLWLGHEWSPAQPSDSLNPENAARKLKIPLWGKPSEANKKYEILQKRFPPQLYDELHSDLRPSCELLANPSARLNWFWSSGLIPPYFKMKSRESDASGAGTEMRELSLSEMALSETLDHLQGLSG